MTTCKQSAQARTAAALALRELRWMRRHQPELAAVVGEIEQAVRDKVRTITRRQQHAQRP